VRRQTVVDFVKAQETRQIFAPAPKSGGKVTATNIDDRWQVDTIDWKQMDSSKNRGYKNVLVAVDVFSRLCWAIPMENKSQESTLKALEGIMRVSGRKPTEVDTDGGLEYGPAFPLF
jgi:hypothetical protein